MPHHQMTCNKSCPTANLTSKFCRRSYGDTSQNTMIFSVKLIKYNSIWWDLITLSDIQGIVSGNFRSPCRNRQFVVGLLGFIQFDSSHHKWFTSTLRCAFMRCLLWTMICSGWRWMNLSYILSIPTKRYLILLL